MGSKKKDKALEKQSTAQVSTITKVQNQNCCFCIKLIEDQEKFVAAIRTIK